MRKSIGMLCFAGAMVIAAAGSIEAAVPIDRVQNWRDSAPEAVNVTVLAVDRNSETSRSRNGGSVVTTRIALTARVDAVRRTVSGLAPGATIVVRYSVSVETPPLPGIQQDFVPDIGQKATAYLKQADANNYMLACAFGCLQRP